jgi:hypothetical protein
MPTSGNLNGKSYCFPFTSALKNNQLSECEKVVLTKVRQMPPMMRG